MEMAVTDGLTGLHNRRYLDSHLAVLSPMPPRVTAPSRC